VIETEPATAGLLTAEDLDSAFDTGPAVRAAALWVDRATAEVERIRAGLAPQD
jgi:hypothetical protein